ncbi:MAG: hypothetical protein J6W49_01985 [Paludibacteraceae bacterium]|nr:hypothetical protein [Paludibacteraceae bacterium]
MKLMKIMPAALLLCLSLGAYAQDEDVSEDAVAEDEAGEVFVPSTPTEKKFFQRVQLGFQGTNVKYTNFGQSPDYNNYFLKGVSLGWMGDFKIAKNYPIYFEIGATFTYHTGLSKGDSIYRYHDEPGDLGDGEYTKRHYRIQAFSVTIPVSVSYQFRDAFNVEDFTLAPYAGVYFRFNAVCNRWETKATTHYFDGAVTAVDPIARQSKSLMSDERNDGWWEHKPHKGTLVQPGVQIGVNAFYKNYTFGLAYMYDLVPFAGHKSSPVLTSKTTKEGGNLPSIGTNCDEKVSTSHNFAITVGYVF